MGQGSIIGYEINEKTCQISFYNEKDLEPDTLEVDTDNYQIPLIIGKLRDTWAYGKEAKRLVTIKDGFTATRLLSKSLAGDKIEFGEETYDAVWLLSQFIQMSLQSFPEIDGIVFTVPSLSEEMAQMLRGIAVRMNIDKRNIFIQDYKESFCNYLFYQPKELWQYDAALFCCDRNEIKAYMLRRLRPGLGGGKTTFVTVDEVASAHMKELAMVYPVLNEDKAKEADAMFSKFIESVFDKRIVSSVFLTGEGFENDWYPKSLRVLCNGRRAFIGNNLYSKGACYTAYRKLYMHIENPVWHLVEEDAASFLVKTRRSVKNLLGRERELLPYVRLLRWYNCLKRFHAVALTAFLFRISESLLEKNLTGKHPSLRLFAFYKLGYFCWLSV